MIPNTKKTRMAILWFLSGLALLSEAYGQGCRDLFLRPDYSAKEIPYSVKLRVGSTKHSCGGSVLKELWGDMDDDTIVSFFGSRHQDGILAIFKGWNQPPGFVVPEDASRVCPASTSDVFNNGDNCVTTNMTYICDSKATSANNQQVAGQQSTEATPDNRQQVTVPILSDDECQKHWGTKSQKKQICTGLSSCMVESGAGLMCERNGTWTLAGIASSSCSTSKPAMFTHMSAFGGGIDDTIPDN